MNYEGNASNVIFGQSGESYFPGGKFIEQPLKKTYGTWWTMPLTNYKVNGQKKSSMTTLAIADTGTSLLYMSLSDYLQF